MSRRRSPTRAMIKRCCFQIGLVVLGSLILADTASAQHQPVMDMAPRWEGGWGFQVRHEYRFSDKLLDGDSETSNPQARERSVNTAWLEGVYTFKRELRLTAKLPWVEQSRVGVQNGLTSSVTGSGLGDAILGLQIKSYYNKSASTGNFGITPSIRIPTGSTADDYPVGDGSWDLGVSGSFSAESAQLYQYYNVSYWHNGRGERGINQGDQLGFNMNIGIHPYHDNLRNAGIFLMSDLSASYESRGADTAGATGGKRLTMGPVFVLYWNNIMARAEWSAPLYENVYGIQTARGAQSNIGIGFTF